ncbi:MAG: hypothetical protein ACJAVK_000392 [Akkermansiaceae bacterium]|jgi:hypothetical protein
MQKKLGFTSKRVLSFTMGLLMVWSASSETVTRQWNEENLAAIRVDFPAPTVHARNLFHLSVAMWDGWAAFDENATGYLHNEEAFPPDGSTLQEAREEAISYAAYRVLRHRYSFSTNSATTLAALDARMIDLGYDQWDSSTVGNSPAALGNRIAASIIDYGANDGAGESSDPGYLDSSGYTAVNAPLILSTNDTISGFPSGWNDLNRWQPLAFQVAFTQNGQVASQVQKFVSPHWGEVKNFGFFSYDQDDDGLYFDPGEPPKLGGVGDLAFKNNAVEVLAYSALLDPSQPALINLSPSARGNNTLGSNDGTGHPVNPTTGSPYPDNFVLQADYGRCVAEYWADGPESETPPGHWNVLANEVTDEIVADPSLNLQIGGSGEILDLMEWEVKLYLALNAALHNTAVAVWGVKEHYDYVRPISAIRFLGRQGDLPLTPGLVEVVTASTAQTYHSHLSAHMGKTAVNAWPGEPANPATEAGGRAWILAQEWLPYQRDTFVTPAFAGYVSGHSGFSRAAAEVMASMTGTPYFPGGVFSRVIPAGGLQFEAGPTTAVTFQWATYFDAADEAGESRLYGGIHVSPDDGPGRVMGARLGKAAFSHAQSYWEDSIFEDSPPLLTANGVLSCPTVPGFRYSLVSGTDLASFPRVEVPPTLATGHENTYVIPTSGQDPRRFFRVEITAP